MGQALCEQVTLMYQGVPDDLIITLIEHYGDWTDYRRHQRHGVDTMQASA